MVVKTTKKKWNIPEKKEEEEKTPKDSDFESITDFSKVKNSKLFQKFMAKESGNDASEHSSARKSPK